MQNNIIDLSPTRLSQEQKQDIFNTIMTEESYFQIEIQLKQKVDEQGVFIVDDPQQALLKLKCFSELLNKERLAYAEHLSELFELIGEDAFRNLGFIMKQFNNDSYSIQIAIVRQLKPIVDMIKRRTTGYGEIKEYILPFLTQFLNHQDYDLKSLVANQLASITPFLDETDRVDIVLAKLVDLAHDEASSQNRIVAAETMGKIAQIFTQQVSESYVCGELLSLGIDLNENVRLKAIQQLPLVVAAISQKYIEQKLVPFFIDKCNERLIAIRCACITVLPGICKYSSHRIKTQIFIQQYFEFLSDGNKEVRKTAYENLGLFISSIKYQQQDQEQLDLLLAYYCNMLDKSINSLSKDSDMVYLCAYYFPGVLLAIGRDRWSQVQQLYHLLLKYPSDIVKRPLSYGFHEVAKILGPDLAKEQLLTILEMLLADKSQDIRNGIIQSLSKFITIFEVNEREYLIDLIMNLQKDQHKWRIRYTISKNIFPLTQCFMQETIFFVIAPILFKMCSDQVAEVRKKAAKNVYHLIPPFKQDSQEYTVIIEQIKAFSKSKRYNQRQAFGWMCYKLFHLPSFEAILLDNLMEVCYDHVPLVRLSSLMVIDQFIQKEGFSKDRKYLKYLLLQFKDDNIIEIQNILSKYSIIINKPRKKSQSIRSKTSNSSGGAQKLDEIPSFDKKIEQIRRNSVKP